MISYSLTHWSVYRRYYCICTDSQKNNTYFSHASSEPSTNTFAQYLLNLVVEILLLIVLRLGFCCRSKCVWLCGDRLQGLVSYLMACLLCFRFYRNVPKSVRTDMPGQTVQTQIRMLAVWSESTLFAIPSASFGLFTIW